MSKLIYAYRKTAFSLLSFTAVSLLSAVLGVYFGKYSSTQIDYLASSLSFGISLSVVLLSLMSTVLSLLYRRFDSLVFSLIMLVLSLFYAPMSLIWIIGESRKMLLMYFSLWELLVNLSMMFLSVYLVIKNLGWHQV